MRDILDELLSKGVRAETIQRIIKAIEAEEKLAGLSERHRQRQRRYDVNKRNLTSSDVSGRQMMSGNKINEALVSDDVRNPPLNNPPLSIQKPKKVSVSRRTQMPADWHPVIRMEDSAEFDRFVNYCKANAKTYADWDAAWRNWQSSPYRSNGQHGRKKTVSEIGRELADECREREREIEQGVFRPPDNVRSR